MAPTLSGKKQSLSSVKPGVKAATASKKRKAETTDSTSKKRKVEGYHEDDDENEDEGDAEDAVDDQTAALLQGFESSEDELPGGETFAEGQAIPEIPKSKTMRKKLKGIMSKAETKPGVVYVGWVLTWLLMRQRLELTITRRIPHGFYEHEMRAYFTQFGDIRRLRLSRNRKTGQSKHYAFIEFASSEVAQIVADTMNNYLLFGHILKCKAVPQEQIHQDLWKGANKRFKKVPWNKLEARRLDMARPRGEWERKIQVEAKKREHKHEQLKAIGYDFTSPALKSVDQVPKRMETALIADAGSGQAEDHAEQTEEAIVTVERTEPNAVQIRETSTRKAKTRRPRSPRKAAAKDGAK